MKKIFTLFVFINFVISLSAFGACPLNKLKTNSACTGAASGVNMYEQDTNQEGIQNNKEELLKMYQIPTISSPSSFKNGFPILNPTANCAFGMCQPR